jgi:KaiC/GvpD/RAD55 family RecA-like ATPase
LTNDKGYGRVPKELLEFLRSPGGHSLVIKGDAGTGKTTLALQLIEELTEEQPEYYLSSRVSDIALYRQFPWLKDKVRRNDILKAGKAFLRLTGAKEYEDRDTDESRLRVAKNLLRTLTSSDSSPVVIRSELKKLEGLIEAGEIGEEDDEELLGGSHDSLILELGILLPEIELAYDLAEMNLPKKTLVVLDSIEGLSERYGIPSVKIMNTLQKDLVENSNTNVIYVLETPEKTELDYLGDGVIVLANEELDGRRARRVQIEKLRGSGISRWKYNFTLAGGRFRVFEPTMFRIPDILPRHIPIEEDRNKASSGFYSTDRTIGGMYRGSVNLIEIGEGVNYELVRYFELKMVADFLLKERGVIWFPQNSMDYALLNRRLDMLVGEEAVKNLRVLESDNVYESTYPFLMTVEGEDASQDLKWNTLEFAVRNSQTPRLSILGFDTLEGIYGGDVLSSVIPYMDSLRRAGHIVLVEATSVCRSLPALSHRSQTHFKLESVTGANMMCGRKPFTPYHFINFIEGESGPEPDFVPMQ